MREEEVPNPQIDKGEHVLMCQLSAPAGEDPSMVRSGCGGATCPGLCASSLSGRVAVQIRTRKNFDI